MLVRLLIAGLVVAAAIGLAAGLLDSVSLHGAPVSILWVSLVLALVHALIGPFLRLVSVREAVLGFVLDRPMPSAS